jgi:tetratricopeptide (TPR) repeat protein
VFVVNAFRFGDLGRMMLPHVSRCMKEYDRITQNGPPVTKATKSHMAALLLASSRFSDNSWKWKVVETTQQILSDDGDPYLYGWATQRKSSLLRMKGMMAESSRTLEECIHSTIFPSLDTPNIEKSRRWNAQRGELVVSFADNLIMNGNTALAEKELREWEPLSPDPISAMELIVLRNRNTTLAKIFREERRFEESIVLFEKVLDESRDDKLYDHTGNRMIILSNLADLYLETGRADDAYKILVPGIELMRSRGTLNISAGRRLNLALTEVYIRQGELDKAEKLLFELQAVIELDKDPDMISKTAMFRVWSGLARISHTQGRWCDALSRWQRALEAGEQCGWAEGKHPLNVVHYSLADVYDELDRAEDAKKLIEQTEASLEEKGGKKFWMVGFATYWLEYVEERMKSKDEYVLV